MCCIKYTKRTPQFYFVYFAKKIKYFILWGTKRTDGGQISFFFYFPIFTFYYKREKLVKRT